MMRIRSEASASMAASAAMQEHLRAHFWRLRSEPEAVMSEVFEAAHAAYDRLLAAPHAVHRAHHDRGVQSHARHLQTPALRLRLLRSALRVLRRWEASLAERQAEPRGGFGAYGGGKRRARATLADVCAGYAGEARRLLQVPASEQGAAEALAAEFEALGKRLASA